MDIETTIRRIRELTPRLLEHDDRTYEQMANDGYELAELVTALDEWLSKGGYAPEAWGLVRPPF